MAREYLNPEVASRLSRLDLIARMVVKDLSPGCTKAPITGLVEFSEYRQYMPGERAARFGLEGVWQNRPALRQTIRRRNQSQISSPHRRQCLNGLWLGPITKFQYASYVAAALSHLMLRQRDAVGLIALTIKFARICRPDLSPVICTPCLIALQNTRPEGGRYRSRCCLSRSGRTHCSARTHRGHLRFFRRSRPLAQWPQTLRHRNHEVIVFHVMDPRERDLDFNRETRLSISNPACKSPLSHGISRLRIGITWKALIARFRRECREALIDYVLLETSEPFDTALFQLSRQHAKN